MLNGLFLLKFYFRAMEPVMLMFVAVEVNIHITLENLEILCAI